MTLNTAIFERFFRPRRLLSAVLLAITVTCFTNLGISQESKQGRKVRISGSVVAASNWNQLLTCWHVCGMQFVIRLDGHREPEYAIVRLAFMDDRSQAAKGPHWKIVDEVAMWEFKATRGADSTLEEFMRGQDEKGQDITREAAWPAWVLLKGAPHARLPYNQSLPSYNVEVGKFRVIK